MAGPVNRHGHRRLYNGTAGPSLWRGRGRSLPIILVLALGLINGGCAFQIDSLFGSGNDSPETTGSITPPPGTKDTAGLPPDNDLVYTKAAVAEVLKHGGKNTSLPWENPRTGARGTVTPIASAYNEHGTVCRDFLASYIKGPAESWMQGAACQEAKGKWQIRSLKPWKRS